MNPSPKPYTWIARLIFWFQKKRYGQTLASAQAWSFNTHCLLGVSWLFTILNRSRSPLPEKIRCLVILRVSQLKACEFCIDLNSHRGLKQGLPQATIRALTHWQNSSVFNDQERLILGFVDQVTEAKGPIPETLMTQMQTNFSPSFIAELTGLIAFQSMSTTFNNGMRVQAQGFCSLYDNSHDSDQP